MPSKFARTICSMSRFVPQECSWVYFIARQRSCGERYVFTCVCLFVHHYPWCIGLHCTAPPPQPQPQPSVETCSNLFICKRALRILQERFLVWLGHHPSPLPLFTSKEITRISVSMATSGILSTGWHSRAADPEFGSGEPTKPFVAKYFGLGRHAHPIPFPGLLLLFYLIS